MSPQLDNGATSTGRKPGRNLSSLLSTRSAKEHSSNSRWAFSKSPAPIAEITASPPEPKIPAEDKKDDVSLPPSGAMDKRQSKMSLFDLFSKPRVERARGFHESGGESFPERSQTPAHFYRKQDSTRQSAASAMVRPPSRSSRARTPSQRAGPAKLERPPPDGWDPPPLFQAYPQAIKHGILNGTSISAETLLRAAHYKNHDALGSMVSLPFVSENGDEQHPTASTRHAQKRFSTLAESLEINEKVFVLTTTGRVVQYPGQGYYDRLPEKILQLCHNSAAFACDLIPGKHWVLQVLQTVNQDGAPAIKQSRSILSRLRVSSASTRKQATSLLMIFNNPEDMDSWLKALRKAIEQLGGKRIEPDPEPRAEKRTAETKPTLTKTLSHRYQVHRDPRQPQPLKNGTASRSGSVKSTGTSILQSPVDEPAPQLPSPKRPSARASPVDSPQIPPADRSGRTSRANRVNSPDVPSVAPTVLFSEQFRLEQLRDSSRHSFISSRTSRTSETEATTMPTSQGSSSPPSPTKESFTEPDTQRTPPGLRSFALSPGPTNKSRRTSFQAQPPATQRTPPQRLQRESSIGIVTTTNASIGTEQQLVSIATTSPIQGPRVRHSKIIDQLASRNSATESIERPISTAAESEDDNTSTRPTSTIGQLPNLSQRSLNKYEQRTESPRKPFVRPIPVKPSEPSSTQQRRASGNPETLRSGSLAATQANSTTSFVPRRLSSFPVTPLVTTTFPPREKMGPGPIPLRTSSRPSSISHALPPSMKAESPVLANEPSPTSNMKSPSNSSPTTQTLRRPNSMQIRSDPAPFLSSRQPQSRVRGHPRSASASPTPFAHSIAQSSLYRASLVPSHPGSIAPPPVPPMNPNRPGLRMRSSMPTIVVPGMPPPAHPPPNIPLPKLPNGQAVS